jgi:hypothetical protein
MSHQRTRVPSTNVELFKQKQLLHGMNVDNSTVHSSCDACIEAKQIVRPFPQECEPDRYVQEKGLIPMSGDLPELNRSADLVTTSRLLTTQHVPSLSFS